MKRIEKNQLIVSGKTCPICRKQFPVPENGISGFPNNYVLQNLLDNQEKFKNPELTTSNKPSAPPPDQSGIESKPSAPPLSQAPKPQSRTEPPNTTGWAKPQPPFFSQKKLCMLDKKKRVQLLKTKMNSTCIVSSGKKMRVEVLPNL